MTAVFNETARTRIADAVKWVERDNKGRQIVRRELLKETVASVPFEFGKANGVITAGTHTGSVNLWKLNDAGTAMESKGETQNDVVFKWMHGGQDISDGKEVIIAQLAGRWHVTARGVRRQRRLWVVFHVVSNSWEQPRCRMGRS